VTSDNLLDLQRETAKVEQRCVRTRRNQEVHVTRLDRFATGNRTKYTHLAQPTPGRGRKDLPASRPERLKVRWPFLLRLR